MVVILFQQMSTLRNILATIGLFTVILWAGSFITIDGYDFGVALFKVTLIYAFLVTIYNLTKKWMV